MIREGIKILFGLFLLIIFCGFISANNVSVWQGQYYTGTSFNTGTYDFIFTVYDALTGGNVVYSNTTSLTTGSWGEWKTEQYGVSEICSNSSQDYFLNINIDGTDQTPRRRLVMFDFLRKDVDDTFSDALTVSGTLYTSHIDSTSPLELQVDGTTAIYINDSTRYVGIGSSNPLYALQVTTGSVVDFFNGKFRFNSTDSTATLSYLDVVNYVDFFGGKFTFNDTISLATLSRVGIANYLDIANGKFLFNDTNSLATLNYVEIVNNLDIANGHFFVNGTSGNTGLGTTTPSQKLNVVGTMNVTGFSYLWGTNFSDVVNINAGLNTYDSIRASTNLNQSLDIFLENTNESSGAKTAYNLVNDANDEFSMILTSSNFEFFGTPFPSLALLSADASGGFIIESMSSDIAFNTYEDSDDILTLGDGNATIKGNLNVTGTSYLGDIIINADNITTNNIIPKSGGYVDLVGDLNVTGVSYVGENLSVYGTTVLYGELIPAESVQISKDLVVSRNVTFLLQDNGRFNIGANPNNLLSAILMDYGSDRAGGSGFELYTTALDDVALNGFKSVVTGFEDGQNANQLIAYMASLIGDDNDNTQAYIAFNVEDFVSNGGSNVGVGLAVGSNYESVLVADSGDMVFSDYNVEIVVEDEEADGYNLTIYTEEGNVIVDDDLIVTGNIEVAGCIVYNNSGTPVTLGTCS